MSQDTTDRGDRAAAAYTNGDPESRAAALTEAITTTITGQPLPEAVRPPAPTRRPGGSGEWFLRVLKGPNR
jgi:hypothetical protein